MDHDSKNILDHSAEDSSSLQAINDLLDQVSKRYRNKESITFFADAGAENINTTVTEFLIYNNEDACLLSNLHNYLE